MRSLILFFLPLLASAQALKIGIIDFYGLRKVSEAQLREVLGVREGDALPGSRVNTEEALERTPGVVRAHVEAICCEGDRTILYVGIEERGAPHFEHRPAPSGAVRLPAEAAEAYRDFLAAVDSLMRDAPSRARISEAERRFPELADRHLAELRSVLRDSADEEQRAIAVDVIGYVADKSKIVGDLQYALQDPDREVRANAVRAVEKAAAAGVRVQPTWLVEMLNALEWSDRRQAAAALARMAEKRDPALIEHLRDRALASIVEMAQWKTLSHALPAFLLLGRMAGVAEEEIRESWAGGDRTASVLRFVDALGVKR